MGSDYWLKLFKGKESNNKECKSGLFGEGKVCRICGEKRGEEYMSSEEVCLFCVDEVDDLLDSNYEKCGFCHTETEGLVLFNVNGEEMQMCRKCRKANNVETEKDVIMSLEEKILTPREIVKELDKYVVGQEEAKKVLAIEMYNHLLRLAKKDIIGNSIRKNNIMLTGKSGTGKTFLIQTLSKMFDIPFAQVSATSLTASGYAGNDVESVLSNLLKQSNGNPNKAKYGIVFIDEIDKIAKSNTKEKDVNGESVQQGLLTIVEGANIEVPTGTKIIPGQKTLSIDTTNILFICSGAFNNIDEIVKSRLKVTKEKTIGFNNLSKKEKELSELDIRLNISTEDLQKFGMIPEFLGRFPALCNLETMDKEKMIHILKSENGLITEYKRILEMQDKKLVFEEGAINKIAEISISKNTGARALRGVMTAFMRDIMYNAPSEDKYLYKVSEEDIKEKAL